MLGYDRICRLLETAEEFGRPAEVTVEINPENIDSSVSDLSGYATRISVGIQSLNANTLSLLGRNAERDASLKALSILSSSGFDFNADIITAVPGESINEALDDIRAVSQFGPGHISYYCLSFEENAPITRRLAPLEDSEESLFLRKGWALLEKLGYEHYEISAFAKPGKRSIHNQVYWDLGQYIGIGATAESSFGYERLISARDNESAEDFIINPGLVCSPLSDEEYEEEYIMLRLRVREGIVKKTYKNRFGYDFDERFKSCIQKLDNEWIVNDSEHFALTEEGFLFLDYIILALVMAI